jgi:hypothetical protein
VRAYIGVTLAATCLLSVGTVAQEQEFVEAIGNVRPVALPPGGDPPRLSDGHIDFSGVWFQGSTGKANAWSVVPNEPGAPQDPIPFLPAVKAKLDSMSRTEIEVSRPSVLCQPVGTPGMFNQNSGYPLQLISKPGMFVQLIESDMNWRVVHTDGRPHTDALDLEPLYNGDHVADWEGDTLVIDTISLHPSTWIQGNGWVHGPGAHVIERLRRPSYNYLEWQFTVEDPDVLSEPWTSNWRTHSLGSEDLNENYCLQNENVDQLRKLVEIEAAGN